MKFTLSVLFTLLFLIGHSQTVKVLEEDTKAPISGVTIFNFKKDKSVITNIDGEASLNQFDDNEILYFQNILYINTSLKKFKIKKN